MKTRQILDTIRTFTTKLAGKRVLSPAMFITDAYTLEDYPLGGELKPYVALLAAE